MAYHQNTRRPRAHCPRRFGRTLVSLPLLGLVALAFAGCATHHDDNSVPLNPYVFTLSGVTDMRKDRPQDATQDFNPQALSDTLLGGLNRAIWGGRNGTIQVSLLDYSRGNDAPKDQPVVSKDPYNTLAMTLRFKAQDDRGLAVVDTTLACAANFNSENGSPVMAFKAVINDLKGQGSATSWAVLQNKCIKQILPRLKADILQHKGTVNDQAQ